MWTAGLADWYAVNGRHDLPWRLTTDPWEVLVSEVMLQQTPVGRVLPRWSRFLVRWPDAASCARADLDDVLREWAGLGYPRRARWLWLTARTIASAGWPDDEAGLRALPGVGAYTARALLAFSSVGALPEPSVSPRDVNLGRVAARAALGLEAEQVATSRLEGVLSTGRPDGMPLREYTYALFDVGALHCRARPRCGGCPLSDICQSRRRGTVHSARRRQPRYEGSLRQLRGAVLAAALRDPGLDDEGLRAAVTKNGDEDVERFDEALAGLVADGLLTPAHGDARARR